MLNLNNTILAYLRLHVLENLFKHSYCHIFIHVQDFQIKPAPGANHWLLQAFAPGSFCIPNYTISYYKLHNSVSPSNHDLIFSRK